MREGEKKNGRGDGQAFSEMDEMRGSVGTDDM